jgi:hypothetical protein
MNLNKEFIHQVGEKDHYYALHVSGGTSTHHQEHTQLYLQHPVLVTPLLLPAAIVGELELVCVWCGS